MPQYHIAFGLVRPIDREVDGILFYRIFSRGIMDGTDMDRIASRNLDVFYVIPSGQANVRTIEAAAVLHQ